MKLFKPREWKAIVVRLPFKPFGYRGMFIFPFNFMYNNKAIKDYVSHFDNGRMKGSFLEQIAVGEQKTINHENIHFQQALELGVIPFYIWYVAEYFVLLWKYRSHRQAYRGIRFEKEAYAFDEDLGYIARRKRWNYKV